MSNPKDIFKYLYQNKIGETVALFYIGWAWVLESLGRYPEAHKIYLKATQKYARIFACFFCFVIEKLTHCLNIPKPTEKRRPRNCLRASSKSSSAV